jgi:hypothetical protein
MKANDSFKKVSELFGSDFRLSFACEDFNPSVLPQPYDFAICYLTRCAIRRIVAVLDNPKD